MEEKETNIVNIEIDYDKLANAIVKTNEKIKEEDKNEDVFTRKAFSVLTALLLYIISIAGFIFDGLLLIRVVMYSIEKLNWIGFNNIFESCSICLYFSVIVLSIGLLSYIIIKMGKDIEKSRDKNYIVSVFSALSCFMALIVALIALFN